ncbi:phosphatidate cytidylyltransferase [Paenibacillus macerans]|uniref:Phosphatidate cytidylyltransferase n=1 Tax=Paenibacillus macerans TaxID=44252 RepID=A0A6N8ESL2_PAEMA|nr:phosphatidate cytidylyltransferase [Paenibacillus macerans]MBS5909855.1 phosphatidate cytidylyltransferase [Paenibacillus macerans]MEC0136010.1 phosphatidate cytidylyltransferase [Paenibacillus macerans]MEC0331081.1 phosphatidate cytidylyltransferase [Paenibacillus macerans]MUG21770.1 phosphatidate cytidylyltransferase [Paenibacillus macerans]UMV46390.1 phosphatidate cytidylyltransferase [Paenibacillus macerans]
MKQRLITGIVAGVFFLGMCWLGGLTYHVLILIMALIGYYEFVRMTGLPAFGGTAVLGYLSVLYLGFPWTLLQIPMPLPTLAILWLLMLLFLAVTVTSKNEVPIAQAALLFLGAVYIGIGFASIAETRSTPDGHGLFWTLLLLAAIWSSDAGAYFTGRRFGKSKLWPAISPNKTVEGALGGVALAVIVAVVFAVISGGLLSIGRAAAVGVSAAVVGQFGDLIQSAYKRVYGVKDTGKLLPGHGGILDRCDSWIVVFPFIHILSLLP